MNSANENQGEDDPNVQQENVSPQNESAKPGNLQENTLVPEVVPSPDKDQKSALTSDPAAPNEANQTLQNEDLTEEERTEKAREIMMQVFAKKQSSYKPKALDENMYRTLSHVKAELEKETGAPFEFHGDVYHFSWNSCFCFSHKNCLRQKLVQLITWKYFDSFITFVILINSVMLGLSDYDDRLLGKCHISKKNDLLDQIGYGLSAIFLCEAIFKIIAMGFVWHNTAYLRDTWNWLDFFVVCVSLIDVIPIGIEAGFLKILRTVRILRPLRSINKVKTLKKLIGSLIKSVPGLVNVGFFLVFVLSIFAIFGINQFNGAQYKRCRTSFTPELNPDYSPALQFSSDPSQTCGKYEPWGIDYDAEWLCNSDEQCEVYLKGADGAKTYRCGSLLEYKLPVATDKLLSDELAFYNIVNFDNYGRAMLSIFVAITLEGWVLMMYNYMDSNSNMFSVIFFTLVVFFGAFLALNLVLAQIMDSFYTQRMEQDIKEEREEKARAKAEDNKMQLQLLMDASQDHPQPGTANNSETLPIVGAGSTRDGAFPQINEEGKSSNTPDLSKSSKSGSGQVVNLIAIGDQLSKAEKEDALLQLKADEQQPIDRRGSLNSQPGIKAESDPSPNDDVPAIKAEDIDQEGNELPDKRDSIDKTMNQEIANEEAEEDRAARLRAKNNACIRFFYNIVTSAHFNFFIFCMIIANTIALAIDDYPNLMWSNNAKFKGGGMTAPTTQSVLAACNDFFTFLFLTEMILKLIALHPRNYFKDSYNCFDSFVVSISVIDYVISLTIDEETIGSSADFLQALRAMRLLRIIKLMRTWKDLQDILSKIGDSLKDISYFTILLVLYMYIMALLGMELFANYGRYDSDENFIANVTAATESGEFMTAPRENFDNVGGAMTTVFILILGEDWPGVMYNYIRVYDGNILISIYFLFVFCLGNLMMLSLFTAILLQNFEGGDDDDEEPEEEIEKEIDLGDALDEDQGDAENTEKKPVSKCKQGCLKLKLEYICAFGTAQDQVQIQKEVDEFNTNFTSHNDRQVYPDHVNKSGDSNEESKAKETLIRAEQQSENKVADNSRNNQLDNNPPATAKERSVSDQEIELQLVNAGVTEKARSGLEGTSDLLQRQRESPDKTQYNHESSHKKNKTTSSLNHIAKLFSDQKATTFLDARSVLLENMTGNAFCCLSKHNCLRRLCGRLSSHKYFDWVILLFITISTVLLAVQSPLDDPNTTMAHVLTYIDYGMTAIFTFEMVIKMISFGLLFNGKDSYLYNGWNILDFVIVTSAIVGLIPGTGDISFLKALRMLRILRPLRLISRNRSLKLAILCLIKAIPSILNLMLIVLFFIFLLGILGTTLFSGKFYTCHMDDMIAEQEGKPALMQNMYYSTEAVKGFEQFIVTKFDCLNYGGEWINSDLNFDTTFTSIITLITIQTTEGWIGVMWNAVDTTKVGFVPIVGQNPQYILLFILLIILICLLFLNLFVGVVCDTFNTEKTKQTNNGLLKEIEKQWIEVQLLAYEAAPVIYIKEQVNDISCFRNFLIRMINHTLFDSFIIMCILLNTLVLACAWYDQSEMIKGVLVNVNYVFMAIFTIEAVLKLIAMKQHYFKDGWNCFDFFVVVCTLIALTIANIPALQVDVSQQATMIRILRILRVLRMFKRAQKLKIISETIMTSLPALGSLGALLFLFIFLFSVIGVQMFAFSKLHDAINYHVNFKSFTTAFLLLLRCATGEAWNELMFDSARPYSILNQCQENQTYEQFDANSRVTNACGQPALAKFYFIAYQVVVGQIFLNLFIAIIVDTFIAQTAAFTLPVKKLDVEIFAACWKKYDSNATGYISWKDFDDFIVDLNESDADFFKLNEEQIKFHYLRENWIKMMEFPMHNEMCDFFFYDVLMLVCRHACESKFYLEHNQNLDDVREKLMEVAKAEGQEFTEEEIEVHAQNECQRLAKEEYDEMICRTVELKEDIELVCDLQTSSQGVARQSQKTLSTFAYNEQDDDLGYYTSKHLIKVHQIISIYKRNKAIRNMSAREKFLFKKSPPLLHKLGLYVEQEVEKKSPMKQPLLSPETAEIVKKYTSNEIAPANTESILNGKAAGTMERSSSKNKIQPAPISDQPGHRKNQTTNSGIPADAMENQAKEE